MQLLAVVRCGIVEQRIPIGQIVDGTRMEVERTHGFEDEQRDGGRQANLQECAQI